MTIAAKPSILEQLAAIVGAANVSADPAVLEKYSRDQSLTPARKPHFVAKPKNVEEIQAIVKLANQLLVPVVPFSSAPTSRAPPSRTREASWLTSVA